MSCEELLQKMLEELEKISADINAIKTLVCDGGA